MPPAQISSGSRGRMILTPPAPALDDSMAESRSKVGPFSVGEDVPGHVVNGLSADVAHLHEVVEGSDLVVESGEGREYARLGLCGEMNVADVVAYPIVAHRNLPWDGLRRPICVGWGRSIDGDAV